MKKWISKNIFHFLNLIKAFKKEKRKKLYFDLKPISKNKNRNFRIHYLISNQKMNFKKFIHFSILVMKLKNGKWKIFKIHFVFKSKNGLYFRYTDYFWILFFFLIVKSNFSIYIKIISRQNIYLGYFFQPITVEVWARSFGLRKILRVGPIFWFIHTKTMHKIQVEEMRDFFSQKNTFEEVSVILQTRHSCIRGYSVKLIKPFCKKRRNFFRDLSRPYANNDFSSSCRWCAKDLLQNLLFWVIGYTVFVWVCERY